LGLRFFSENWEPFDHVNNAKSIIGTVELFYIAETTNEAMLWDSASDWIPMQSNVDQVVNAYIDNVYLQTDGSIRVLDMISGSWKLIGNSTSQIAGGPDKLYKLSTDKTVHIYMGHSNWTDDWNKIGHDIKFSQIGYDESTGLYGIFDESDLQPSKIAFFKESTNEWIPAGSRLAESIEVAAKGYVYCLY